jgi:hypothetical protein
MSLEERFKKLQEQEKARIEKISKEATERAASVKFVMEHGKQYFESLKEAFATRAMSLNKALEGGEPRDQIRVEDKTTAKQLGFSVFFRNDYLAFSVKQAHSDGTMTWDSVKVDRKTGFLSGQDALHWTTKNNLIGLSKNHGYNFDPVEISKLVEEYLGSFLPAE